jgi:hypothetical protein
MTPGERGPDGDGGVRTGASAVGEPSAPHGRRPQRPFWRAGKLARLRPALGRALRPARRAAAALRGRPGPAREIQLTWTGDPATSLTVCWAGGSGSNPALLEIRPAEGGPWTRVRATSGSRPGSFGRLHTAVARDLAPGCAYEYRVSSDAGCSAAWSEVHPVRTAPGDRRTPCAAVFLCDVGLAGRPDGTCEATRDVLDAIRAEDPCLVLGGGDYAYANRDPRFLDPADAIGAWFSQMQPLLARAPFMAQLGNHEIELGEALDEWAPRLPRLTRGAGLSHSFDAGPAHFVGLHAPGRAPSPADLDWLEADLTSETARSACWRIVYQHAPVFSHGSSHPARPELRTLMETFDRLGVDLHLSGHDQSYERTHALRADGRIVLPHARDPWPVYAAGHGVVYAKVSPAGKLSDRGGGFSRLRGGAPAEIAASDDGAHHWAQLRISASTLCVNVKALPRPGHRVATADTFGIVRNDASVRSV